LKIKSAIGINNNMQRMKKLEKLVLLFFYLTSCKLMVYGILNLEKVEKSANPPLIVLGQVIAEVLEI
jgi:hypothetical protein